MSREARLVLKPGREKSLLRRHPWVFSGAVARVDGEPALGDTLRVDSADGAFLARAAWSPNSQIVARAWTFHDEPVDAAFLRRRLEAALALRADLLPGDAEALRLVHAESDGLPGLVVDRYGPVLVMQCLSAGAEVRRESYAALLMELTGAACVWERSDGEVRELEGLPVRTGLAAGTAPELPVTVRENGLAFRVDVAAGHKTGFYLDQRDNRARLRELARGRDVLDCFCYSGGFALNALAGGARSVLAIDSSGPALDAARANAAANGLDDGRVEWREANVFENLRRLRDGGKRFGLIVLDPPKFAPTAAHAQRAARGYKDINLSALRLLAPGGILLSFSCSGGIDADLFRKIVAGAASDARVDALVVGQMHGAADHPSSLSFPEGEYLKGLACRVA